MNQVRVNSNVFFIKMIMFNFLVFLVIYRFLLFKIFRASHVILCVEYVKYDMRRVVCMYKEVESCNE